jgi:hypothetical protein
MLQPTIRVLGAYQVELTDELFREAMETKYGGMELSESQRQQAEANVREELSSVVLLEVLVENADERFDVGDFSQRGSDQVAYDEAYLALDGTSVVSRFKAPESDSFRVVFFLHFFDPTESLVSSYGEVPVPAIQEMPERLRSLVSYEPVG